jgi:pyruvate ferredoxin oxidoreductase alpha subunit
MKALEVYDEVAERFEEATGRANPSVECYRTDDAEFIFIMMGAFATKARQAVDQLREAGWPIGLVRPRLFRPFPEAKIREALTGTKGVAVIDQNISFGRGGVLYTELASAILGQPDMPAIVTSFIGGLGGRDISAEEFYQMAEVTKQAVADGKAPEPRLLYTETELREVRKLQDIAKVERHELENEQ